MLSEKKNGTVVDELARSQGVQFSQW